MASVAHAGPGDRDDQRAQRPDHQMPSPQERQDRQRQFDTRQFDARQFDARNFEARAEEQRRNLQMQQDQQRGNEMRRGGRLTPDERRDLRRQINEAGIDLYPNAQRGR
ncbi:hypothetical protein D3872_12990 [Massilia cavernae]|uniref:Uncharacterized protein n=2 Tax=Massilia cavernae TaxID=2320864 RepID=A0A418XSJ9_9BURK|nr:hypothetical protein D3872_12990 [Massilia cavernae]